jgi:hypothetical protein
MLQKTLAFDLYRYQILPIERRLQRELFGGYTSMEELLAAKNDLFLRELLGVENFKTSKTQIRHEVLFSSEEMALMRFAAGRSLKLETEDFSKEQVENWPSFLVFLWNRPDQQLLAIQERQNAFATTDVVAKALGSAINPPLGKMNLRWYCKPLFSERNFWELLGENEGRIKEIRFEIITPNMSNISDSLEKDLVQFAKDSNAVESKIDLKADPNSSILISEDDPRVKGLVEYSSKGGGDITLRLRGVSKLVHTKESKKRIDIPEMDIEGLDSSEVADILKNLLS